MTTTKTFDAQIPELVRQLENALRSGYNLYQSFDIVAKDMQAPMQTDVAILLQDLRDEIPFPDALDKWLERTPSKSLDWLIATMHVQFEVGGNLADKFSLIAQIMGKCKL